MNGIADMVNCRCKCLPGYEESFGRCLPISTLPISTYPFTTTPRPCLLTCINGIEDYVNCRCKCNFGYEQHFGKCVPITTTKKPCALDCRFGQLINTGSMCYCLCYEFHRFDGTTCVLSKIELNIFS
jgi:hypothetical protein